VADYLTSVKDGGFYGWPYSYWGQHVDPRLEGKGMDMVEKAIVPEVSLGAHTASLGLAFYEHTLFPEHYRNGAFIGQHGSWNRSSFSGYKVVFVLNGFYCQRRRGIRQAGRYYSIAGWLSACGR
jgi:glucose/arabinose dehydrogenase